MGIVNKSGALYMATGVDNTGLYKGKREAMGIIKAMAGEVTSFDVFGGIGISAAVTFAKAAKDAYTFEKDFQKSMYEVASISSMIKGSLTDYMNSIIEMTRQIPVAANNSAKALYQIVSAGHDGANAMNILEVSAKAAVGGVTDTATAADAITTVLNAYKMSANEAGKVSDMLFMTAKLGKTTMGELGQTIAQAAPIAASFGVEIDQVLSAVASLTKQGTPTAQAMTQIRASILGVSKVLGDGAFDGRTYQEALTEVAERAGGSESKLRALVPEIEAINAVLGLTGNNAMTAASDLNELGNSLGASETAFKTMQKSADNQLKLLQNNIISTFRPLGEGLLKEVAGAAHKMNEAFSSGDMKSSLQTMETLVKLVSVAFVGYKVATMDALKTTNAEATVTKISTAIKAAYHKVIGDGIVQKETERLSQEAYVASLESSISVEQRALLEKMNLKKGSKEYADALSEIAVNSKRSADQEIESISKSLEKSRAKLSSVKERVEVSKTATEAAKNELNTALQANDISATEVAQSKVIAAAKREEAAVTDMNTVGRKINNQEKRLGIAQARAESASTMLNSATTAGNTAATTMSTRAHSFLAAAKLKASIATRTLTASLAANPLGAILTLISLAATAWLMFSGNTEKAKTKLQEFREEQDKLKESTNSLINTLYDENESDRVRIEALERLKEMLPDVWKGVTLETLALKDRNKALKETNTLLDDNNTKNLHAMMLASRKRLEELQSKHNPVTRVTGSGAMVSISTTGDYSSDIKKEKEQLRELEKQYYATQSSKQKLIDESLPVDTRISIYEKELKDLQTQIEKVTNAKKQFSLTDWGDAPKLPSFGDVPQFTSGFDLQLLEKQEKETKEKLEAARRLKNPKKTKTVIPATEDEKREAEKRKNTLEDIAKTVLGVELKLQQERVNIMADGREKALSEIEVDKKARLQAIDDEENELKKKYASVGKSMPSDKSANFTRQRETVNADAGYKTEAVNKDYDQKEIDFQKELSSVFLTEEEKRKQSIVDRYDSLRKMNQEAYNGELRNIELTKTGEEAQEAKAKAAAKYNAVMAGIAKAQTVDEGKGKKEQMDGLIAQLNDYKSKEYTLNQEWDKKIADAAATGNAELQQRVLKARDEAMSELNGQMLQRSEEWQQLFGDLDNLTVTQIENLIATIESQMKDLKLNPIDAKVLTKSLNEAKQRIISENPFGSLGKAFSAVFKEGSKDSKDSTKNIKQNWKDLAKATEGSFEFINDAVSSCGVLGDLLGESGKQVMGMIQGIATAGIAMATAIKTAEASSIILAAISLALQAVTALFAVFNGDNKKEKKIQSLQKSVEELDRAYNKLGRTIENTYSNQVYSLMDQQEANLRKQQELIRQQIKEEESKKKSDGDKIQEWKDKLISLDNAIEDSNRKQIEMWAGTDIQSAIDDFADALVEAYAQGEDGAKAMGDTTKKVLANAVKEALKKQILGQAIQSAVTQLGRDMEDGKLSDADKKRFEDTANAAGERFTEAMKMYDELFKDTENTVKNGVTGQLQAAMTEGTASQLVGLWNMTALDIRALKDMTVEYFRQAKPYMLNVESILAETRQINANTLRTANNTDGIVDSIESGFTRMGRELSEIKSNTKSYNGRG